MLKICNITLILLFLTSLVLSQINSDIINDKILSKFKNGKQLKILIYSPSLSWSHAKFLGTIADTLVDAGHEVHFFKYIMSPVLKYKNETMKVDKIYVIEPSQGNAEKVDVKNMPMIADTFSNRRPFFTIFDHPIIQFDPMMATVCKETIKQPKLLQKLTNENFDVGIAEMYDYTAVALFHKIGIRTKIKACALPLFQMISRKIDIPSFASFIPNIMAPRMGLESSFFLRFINFYNEFFDWLWIDEIYLRTQDKIIREEFGADFPNLRELVKNVSIMFFNSNPFLELTRPISNKIVNIGGLVEDKASDESKKLDNRTKRILDSAKEGAVLFSLGSITDTTKFNKNMINAIIDAFRKFPNIHFIWKVDKETINNKLNIFNSMPNVHLFEWIQQPAILAHPNLRAFITHCGQNSLYESARAGVPIIGIPLFGDQFYNAIVGETRGLGIQIDISDLYRNNAENLLIDALERILYEPIYRQNAKIISKKIKLTPFSPTERLVKWVEFAAEFGDLSELNLPGEKEMNWFVYYSIDVISFSIIVLIILVWIIIKSAKWLLLSINSIFLWSRKLGKLEKKLKKK